MLKNSTKTITIGGRVSSNAVNPFWLRTAQNGSSPHKSNHFYLSATFYKEYDSTYNLNKKLNKFNFGFGAPGQRMLITQLTEMMKVTNKPMMIPYKGGAQVITDLLGGHITSAMVPFNIVANHIESGALRLIAINTDSTLSKYPNVTLLQKKYPAWQDFDWYCLVLPPTTPAHIRKTWFEFMRQYLSDPIVLEEFKQEYAEPVSKDQKSAEATVKTFIKRNILN